MSTKQLHRSSRPRRFAESETDGFAKRPRVMLAIEWLDYELNLGVAEFARKHGWIIDDVVSHTGQPDPDWTGDGIIALLRHKDSELTRFVKSATVPVVDLVNELPEIDVPRVLADNYAIGRTGAEHLLSCGLHHLAFVNLWDSHVERERMAGFRTAVEEAGRTFYQLRRDKKGKAHAQTLEFIREQISKLPRPLGAMGHSDREATYIIQACEMAGLHVPEEVAVVGSDNDPILCELGPVPVSSVDNRRRNQGYEAAALLDQLMNGDAPPKEAIRVPTGPVILRHSSEVLAVPDPDLSRALRFIAENYRKSITVQDVVDHVDVTRRRLYMLFEEHLGRPIHAEILRRRLDLARNLLVTTTNKLFAVARACGFSDAQQFTRVFTRESGIAPSRYRHAQGQRGDSRR
ncbi:MAG: xylR 8 [Phycisphaerales bacterium]|nr:xylR 8 [Phycisphaerales bacterium]